MREKKRESKIERERNRVIHIERKIKRENERVGQTEREKETEKRGIVRENELER